MRKRLAAAGLAAAALAFGAAPASAEVLVPSGSGLTEPGGVVRTPDGALWVADGLRGICQVSGATLVPSPFCQAEGAATEVVGPVTAPTGTFDLAFDAASNTFWAAEGTSASGGVWRLDWNPLTGAITSAQKIADTPGDRVFGLDITGTPGGLEVDFVSKRSRLVQRITDATGPAPSVGAVGTAIAEDVADVARLDGRLYLAEGTGVTVVETPGGVVTDAVAVPELAGNIAGALIADPDAGRLYVGTANPVGADQVIAFEPATNRAEGYAGGLAGISALSMDTASDAVGSVLAADDPATASGAIGAEGGGRIMRFANVPLGRPRVILDAAPPVVGTTTTVAFSFSSSRPDATFECSLDGGAWVPCGGPGTGTVSYGPLADGAHEVAIRATDPDPAIGTGAALRHVFVLDTGGPSVTVDNPASDHTVTGGSLDLRFTADEGGVTFDCAVDGAASAPCSSPLRLRNLALGDHEVVVTATDLVGHTSSAADPAARWAFKVVPVPPKPPAEQPRDNSGPGGGDRPRTPDVIRPFATASSSSSCRSSVTSKLDMRRPPAVVRIAFPGGFRPGYVRMAITKKGKRGKKAVTVASMHRVLETTGACTKVSWGLWRSEGRRLRTGRYTLTVQAGKGRRSLRRVWAGTLRVVR